MIGWKNKKKNGERELKIDAVVVFFAVPDICSEENPIEIGAMVSHILFSFRHSLRTQEIQ